MHEQFEIDQPRYVECRLTSQTGGWRLSVWDIESNDEIQGSIILHIDHNPHCGFYELLLCTDEQEIDLPFLKWSNGRYAVRPYPPSGMYDTLQEKVAQFYKRGTYFDASELTSNEDNPPGGLL